LTIPVNPSWYDVSLRFYSYTSSNTCNPYAIAFVQQGAIYPFTGQYVIVDTNSEGSSSPGWTVDTYGYYFALNFGTVASSSLLTALGSNVTYIPFFVFNDTSVEIDGLLEFSWLSQGPNNIVYSLFA